MSGWCPSSSASAPTRTASAWANFTQVADQARPLVELHDRRRLLPRWGEDDPAELGDPLSEVTSSRVTIRNDTEADFFCRVVLE